MPHLLRSAIVVICVLFTTLAANAFDITGKVIDSSSEAMPDATVRLLNSRDSSFVKGTVADENGAFRLTGIKNGKYILECSYIAYTPTFTNVQVSGKNVNVTAVTLQESSIMLSDIVVKGVKTAIKVMEDTIEFNADSYKTQPNAVVEDLLKRLPGVEVGTDGAITANGKTISKILVTVKNFLATTQKLLQRIFRLKWLKNFSWSTAKASLRD